jgi:hypothetical protein
MDIASYEDRSDPVKQTCKIKVRNVLFVCLTYAHVEYIKCALQSVVILIQTVRGKTVK